MAIPSLEVSFIQERAGAIDPAFAMPSTFDEQRAIVGPKVQKHALKAAMEQYQALDCRPKLDLDVNNCSWPEVFKLLETVQEDYAAKARKGLKGAFRRMGRDAGENSDTIKPLLDIIPDEFGGSVIRSALGWMFIVAKQSAQARTEIFELFAEIPSIIMEIGEARKDFPRDDELMRLADLAEAEIVNATLKLIKFLLPEHHLVKKVFTTFSDVPSTSSVSDIVSNVRARAQALKRGSDVHMKGVGIDTNRNTRVLIRETQTTRYNTFMINGKVDQVGQQLQDIRRDEQNMLDRLTTAIEAQNGLFRFLREMREAYQQELESINSRLAWALQMSVNLERHRAQTVPVTLLSTDQLLLDLNVTSHQLVVDLEQALRQGSRLDRLAMGQAQQLLKMDRFWSWYSRISSDLITVHGKFTNEAIHSRISPLSATSATLVTSILRERQGDIALYFFCGQHTSSQDPLAGPRGVMRCLLARLLLEVRARCQFDIYLEPISANAIVEGNYSFLHRRRNVMAGSAQSCSPYKSNDSALQVTGDRPTIPVHLEIHVDGAVVPQLI
ncbi:hypothetical protein PFICI_11386 [Pestalotiopsis fici W106-1]|uniref:Uncharacterized protein n=1 Tax=Pestalotiopsis fici (strain W106-1 / CGMCC3.15140) TaxID=1229662 RepID=W3WWJ7_PESFW|nr:uncharacterized protein PFICI_11386 [Pestalotiopsis fici W106-1]ETS77512.1 hypothetical protein PFICI_11386 [Pestalotiopsis fici W106-1]